MRSKTVIYHEKPGGEYAGLAYCIETFQDNTGIYALIRDPDESLYYRFRPEFDICSNQGNIDGDGVLYDSLQAFVYYIKHLNKCPNCGNLLPC